MYSKIKIFTYYINMSSHNHYKYNTSQELFNRTILKNSKNTHAFVPTLESMVDVAKAKAKECKEQCKKAEEDVKKAENALKNAQNVRYRTYRAKAEERRRQYIPGGWASSMTNEELLKLQRKMYENSKSTNHFLPKKHKSRKIRK
jgi:hypothetical protein